jgi:7,8-dihydro-6-hydroxymethylpterin-pyrophosphokinase
MNGGAHNALIYIAIDLVGGVEKAKDILRKFTEFGEIAAISSVYKRFLTPERKDISARIEFVVRLETARTVDQVLHLILSYCQEGQPGLNRQSYTELTLLAYDDLILMSPKLTLPYPLMHQDPLVIRAAAEAWGQYAHPIYEKNLSELSRNAPPAQQAEFYMQGKSLVDF